MLVQAKEREEVAQLRKLHTFRARPAPKTLRQSAGARLYASTVAHRPATQPRPFHLTNQGSSIPQPSPGAQSQNGSSHGVMTPHGVASRFASGLRS
jgi:hypothetical protein